MMRKVPSDKALIGKRIFVEDASNNSLKGIEGEIIDETRNTLTIRTTDGKKVLPKEQVTLRIENERIEGAAMKGRPEERIKESHSR